MQQLLFLLLQPHLWLWHPVSAQWKSPCLHDKYESEHCKPQPKRSLWRFRNLPQRQEFLFGVGESAAAENPDKRSFSVEIPKAYNEYDVFIVSLTDVFGLKYKKEVRGVSKAGRTDVVLTEDDYVERRGDLKRRIDKFFNGE